MVEEQCIASRGGFVILQIHLQVAAGGQDFGVTRVVVIGRIQRTQRALQVALHVKDHGACQRGDRLAGSPVHRRARFNRPSY